MRKEHPTASRDFLYKRLAADIKGQIKRGELRAGEKLPSLRNLQKKLGLSLNTVYQAYMELETEGLVDVQPKSGFFVKGTGLLSLAVPRFVSTSAPPKKVRLSEITNTVVANSLNPDLVPLGASTLATDLLPQKHLGRIIRTISPECMTRLLQYEISEGAVALRRRLTFRMLGLIPFVREKDVTITNGCTEAVALALLATTRRGDVVAVESPTHFGFLQLLRELGRLVLELPTDPRFGLVLDGLARVLEENKVRACLFMPNFQNPMGALMTDDGKEELVAILHRLEIPVIEDDIYAEMFFGKKRPRLLKHWDQKGLVMTCSSFSKILSPGLRVGWVVANGKAADRIRRLKAGLSMTSPTLSQHVLAEFLKDGALDRYLRLLKASVFNQVLKTAVCVQTAFPEECRLAVPEGGNMLWIELPPWADGIRLYRDALDAGISIVPGAAFSTTGHYGNYLRISCTSPFSDRIETAIFRLGELIRGQNS
jgi:DNA-binding transcriptional MocR family regulator